MQYINKNTGKVAAHLNFGTHPNTWEIYPASDNRYRVVIDSFSNQIEALDLNIGSGMIEVGKKLPGYNKVIESIERVDGGKGYHDNDYFEVTCYLK